MPDRPPQPGEPSSGEPREYGWLYGGQQEPTPPAEGPDPAASADDSDHTRVLPTVPRSGAGQQRAQTSPAGPPPATPSRPAGSMGSGPRRPRRRRPWGKIVLALVVLWIVFLVAVPFWAWSKVDKVNPFPSGHRPAAQPGTTYLLVGSDSREGLSKAENRKLGTGGVAVDKGRTDTILLLHTGSGPSVLLSIPRDSLVPIPGHGTQKINSAFAYGGPKLLVQTIEQDTGVRVDHYVEIGLGGFVNAVNAIGGVQICPSHAVNDRRANLHVKKGCQSADGATALAWARSRHAFPRYGDIRRAQHQREIINKIGSGVKSPWTVINPFRYVHVADAASTSLKVDKNMSVFNAVSFALAMSRVNGKNGKTCSMPISDLAVHWDPTRAPELLKYIKQDRTADIPKRLCTNTGLAP